MEQINDGAQEDTIETRDICILCDYRPNVIQRDDRCTCCDAEDWKERDQ